MDLKLSTSVASAEERRAVDSILGPETDSSRALVRNAQNLRVVRGGESLRQLRHQMLPVLHAVNDQVGWISRGAINLIAQRLDVAPAEIYGVASFYALFSTIERPRRQIHVCIDLACRAAGGYKEYDLPVGTLPSPCLGVCERAPATLVIEAGNSPRRELLAPSTAGEIAALVAGGWPSEESQVASAVPQLNRPDGSLVLLRRVGSNASTDIAAYQAHGGFKALGIAFEIGATRVIAEITTAGLVGRGGAAFPTGRKWDAVASQGAQPHYIVCNADESEPGTFKDRVILEGDPFAVVESMIIAGFATGCTKGWIYLRGEYPRAWRAVHHAIETSREKGFLGENILGSEFSFDIEIIRGAGAYICGEETAIFNSIEGYRGEPRNKPPFPVEVGLFGKPTLVNNVETLVNVLPILQLGGATYAGLGTAGSNGYKLFCVSGAVTDPGVYEVEFGVTLGELIDLAGGMRHGSTLRAVLLGGAAGGFVGPNGLDLPLTLEGTRQVGSSLGSGVVLVLDTSVDMIDQLQRIAAFFRDESCGQCVPCRVGTVRQQEVLLRLSQNVNGDDLELLRELGQVMRDASICGLGQTANNAIASAITDLGVFAS
ncbi:MAG: NADH-ubiquinone oxidoreductase-F iron-sulfur binding region domain-containing protein [Ilumatobacteraceae bacterium]